jgi:hypothetical protein
MTTIENTLLDSFVTSETPTFIFVDGSYYTFHRYFSIMRWRKSAHPEEPLDNPFTNDDFVEKFKQTFVTNLKAIPKYKSEKKAGKLSSFLPGTGQIYAGYFAEGVVSVLFQLAGLSFGVYSFFIKNYITSVLIGYSFFQKFYLGGVQRAEFLVRKRNYLVKRKFNDKAKNYILSIY